MKRTGNWSNWVWIILVIVVLTIPVAAVAAEPGPCATEENIEKEIAKEAQLEALTCEFKKWEGGENLHFNVSLKNVSDSDQRYKVNIFLDNGKAVGGLIPRQTNKGLVKPGESASFTYPVKGMAKKPEALIIIVKTISE